MGAIASARIECDHRPRIYVQPRPRLGALVGAVWGGFAGFVFGWFTAFCRNFILAVSLFVIRTRAELARTRDFLDHV